MKHLISGDGLVGRWLARLDRLVDEFIGLAGWVDNEDTDLDELLGCLPEQPVAGERVELGSP